MTRPLPLLLLAACTGALDPDAGDSSIGPPPDRVDPDLDGPYQAGVTTLEIARDDLPPLTVEVWYPAVPAVGDTPDPYDAGGLVIEGGAFRDAPPDPRGGPRAVVAFSHGYGGIRFQSIFLTEHLARHGFVVVAPDHRFTTMLDLDGDLIGTAAARRPTDVADAVDALVDPGLPGLDVDARTYAVTGHSFGAWTALAVGGGALDAEGFVDVCATTHPRVCRFFDGHPPLDPVEVARWARPDPRVAATVAISPGGAYAFGPDGAGLAGVVAPLVIGGDVDGELPYDSEIVPVYEALGTPRWLATIEGTGHWAVSDMCELLPIEDCAGTAGGYLDPARVHDLVRTVTLAHLRARWLGDAQDLPWLASRDDLVWTAAE